MKTDFCVICGVKKGLEQHHVIPKSLNGGDSSENKITVCSNHHGMIHGVSNRKDISELTNKGIDKLRLDELTFIGCLIMDYCRSHPIKICEIRTHHLIEFTNGCGLDASKHISRTALKRIQYICINLPSYFYWIVFQREIGEKHDYEHKPQ